MQALRSLYQWFIHHGHLNAFSLVRVSVSAKLRSRSLLKYQYVEADGANFIAGAVGQERTSFPHVVGNEGCIAIKGAASNDRIVDTIQQRSAAKSRLREESMG
jgi:hypothetical protein